jgi:tRNA-specific 2-thiouridylase
MASSRRRVAIAMSGGVDSSVAAYLLSKQKKYNLVGLHMRNWESADEDEPQCLEQDRRDAQAVCRSLQIPLHHASFAPEYWTHVFEPFVDGISQGIMPNPDVTCNSEIKFGAMKEYTKKRLGIDWIATGHYARLWNRNDISIPSCIEEGLDGETIDWLSSWGTVSYPLLLSAADLSKDQSYFLANVDGRAFQNVMFPLGDLYKKSSDEEMSVRALAREARLPTAQKRESMGICFVGKRDFGDFIHQYLPEPPKPGNFVDVDTGQVVGTHKGSLLYTIGQGAKISGASKRWFVVGRAKDDDTTLLVCSGTHHAALYSDSLFLRQIHWIGGNSVVPPPLQSTGRMRVKCRTRHLQPLVSAEISGNEQGGWIVRFDKPIRAITPGQLTALYVGDDGLVCLGGGIILERSVSYHEQGKDLPTELHPAGHNDLSVENEKYG